MRRLLWGVLVFLMVFSATSVLAINEELGTVELQQPNGVKFTVRRFVDELVFSM